MLKKALVVTSAAIALSAAASLPASATFGNIANNANPPARVPEPSIILGTLVVGGIGLFGAKKNSAKSNQK